MKIATLVFLAILLPASALAQNDNALRRGHCQAFAAIISGVNLGPAQTAEVKTALSDYFTNMESTKSAHAEALRTLFIAVNEPKEEFDAAPVRAAFESAAAIEEERVVYRAELMHDLSEVLTPKQYRKVVAAHVQLAECALAPFATYRALLKKWLRQ